MKQSTLPVSPDTTTQESLFSLLGFLLYYLHFSSSLWSRRVACLPFLNLPHCPFFLGLHVADKGPPSKWRLNMNLQDHTILHIIYTCAMFGICRKGWGLGLCTSRQVQGQTTPENSETAKRWLEYTPWIQLHDQTSPKLCVHHLHEKYCIFQAHSRVKGQRHVWKEKHTCTHALRIQC